MLINDKNIFDSARTIDNNGYMHVDVSNLTKEQVVPYKGDTIPGWKELNLDPEKIYMIYRPGDEIEKAADSFNGLPLMLDHWDMDADNIPKQAVVGSLGTDARYEAPYLKNSLTVIDADAIKAIEDGSYKELSASYSCDIDMTGGVFDGKTYDGRMLNIKGNHVALVPEGRAGHDVKVADSAMTEGGENMNWMEKLKLALLDIITDKEAMSAIMGNEEIKKEELKEEVVEQPFDANENQTPEPAPEQAQDEDVDEAMKAANLDPADEAQKAAFLAGMLMGKAKKEEEKEEVKEEVVDEDQSAVDECGTKDCGTAKDSALVHDKAFYAGLYKAAEDVAPFVGRISNPFAFDSAADIYKKALDKAGVVTDGIDPSAFGAMVSMLAKPQAIPQGKIESDPLNDRLMQIKSR